MLKNLKKILFFLKIDLLPCVSWGHAWSSFLPYFQLFDDVLTLCFSATPCGKCLALLLRPRLMRSPKVENRRHAPLHLHLWLSGLVLFKKPESMI